MDVDHLLKQYTIANPCPMEWDTMIGDDRARYCNACGKHVHDLTMIAPDAAVGLLKNQRGDLCVQLHEREDGTLTTQPDPALVQPRSRPFQFTIRAITGVIAGVAAMLGITRLFADHTPPPAAPPPARLVRTGGVIMLRDDLTPKAGNPPGSNTAAALCTESTAAPHH